MPPVAPENQSDVIRVLIVDDSAFMRAALTRLIGSDPQLKVVGTARDGKEGVDKAKELKPDAMTLDIEMPNVDGLTALRTIRREMRENAPSVLMCSSLTTDGSHAALSALRLGAADVIAKDASNISSQMDAMRDDLIAKIKAIVSNRPSRAATPPATSTAATPAVAKIGTKLPASHRFKPGDFELLLIGSSTGGPPVLETILTRLPASVNAPIVVAQHMPFLFTKSMATRLDETCNVNVVHAEEGMPLLPGTVYIAPGGTHTKINRTPGGKLLLTMSEEPKTEVYRPGVNVLFGSAAKSFNGKVLAMVLTGMGEDGVVGARELKARGNVTFLAQEGTSCVVYGMPRAIVNAGLADAVGTPEELALMLSQCGAAAKAA